LQILGGFTHILPLKYVQAEPIRTITRSGRRRDQAEIIRDLELIPRGVVGWGYLEPSDENVAFLCRPDRVNYFIYRDPRDMLVSQVYFATDMYEDHGMHAYYKSLPGFSERLKVAITGLERSDLKMVSVRERYEGVLAWRKIPHVLCLRYEDLIERQAATLETMLEQIEKAGYTLPTSRGRAVLVLSESVRPRQSRTFRVGRPGGWREHFTAEHKHLFREVAGDLLVELGYEQTNDW
jgi:hypothetical protein